MAVKIADNEVKITPFEVKSTNMMKMKSIMALGKVTHQNLISRNLITHRINSITNLSPSVGSEGILKSMIYIGSYGFSPFDPSYSWCVNKKLAK